ncbi:hypothetical protein LINGRAHAP2_LOCUS29356 [Linum grandiflorum]
MLSKVRNNAPIIKCINSSQVSWFLLFTSKRFSTYKSCCRLLTFFRIRSYLAVRLCFGWLFVLAEIIVGRWLIYYRRLIIADQLVCISVL